MTVTIDASFIRQYSDNLHILLEQKESKTRSIFPVEVAKGEYHNFERLGAFQATEVTGRFQDITVQDPAHSRRVAIVKKYAANTYLDGIDSHKMLLDPTSQYSMELARAHGKTFDDVVFNSLIGTALTGKDGTGTEVFDSNNIITTGGGLTVAKFNAGLRIMESNEVDIDSEELFLFVGAHGMEDLFGDTSNQLTSFDFQNKKIMAEGGLPTFRGVKIIRTQRVPEKTAGSVARAILCTRNAFRIAMAHDLQIKVGERLDKEGAPMQLITTMMYGGVRMEENRAVIIEVTY